MNYPILNIWIVFLALQTCDKLKIFYMVLKNYFFVPHKKM